ncbi:MAG: hypothetical protein EOM54_07835 [Clostridia bacterium]|nr:hypothetical protein [Clostridia bacterium]
MTGPFDITYFFIRLSLFIVAVVMLFMTVLMIPPLISLCALLLFIPPAIYGASPDKSVVQKRE